MTYLTDSAASATSNSRSKRVHQFQQIPWTYEYGEGRTAVTYTQQATELTWSEKSTSAILFSETQFQWLEKLYVFRSNTEVRHTLREYPFLAQLLLDTYSKIEEHFPNSRVFLEVAIDYEAFEEYAQGTDSNKELVISISTSLLPGEAMKTFKEFYDRWWAKASRDAKGKISIGLEFL